MSENFTILCKACQVPVGLVADSVPETVVCQSCGLRAPLEEAMEEITDQLADDILGRAFDGIQSIQGQFFSLNVTTTKSNGRLYRFVKGSAV
jgi:hypothetical protein